MIRISIENQIKVKDTKALDLFFVQFSILIIIIIIEPMTSLSPIRNQALKQGQSLAAVNFRKHKLK